MRVSPETEADVLIHSVLKHHVKIIAGDYSVHHVSTLHPKMFMPHCSCKWEGPWVQTREAAKRHGCEHIHDPKMF